MDALRTPPALGSKTTVNVVDPDPAIGLAGCTVTEKSLACAPLMITLGESVRLRSPGPILEIVNVWLTVPLVTATMPKSVLSELYGVVSPSKIMRLFPFMLISGPFKAARKS